MVSIETIGHVTIIFIFKPTYRPDLQAISTRTTEDQIGMALLNTLPSIRTH